MPQRSFECFLELGKRFTEASDGEITTLVDNSVPKNMKKKNKNKTKCATNVKHRGTGPSNLQ